MHARKITGFRVQGLYACLVLPMLPLSQVYSRLVNDPRALRHLPGSFVKTADSGTSPTVQQQQQQQQRSDNCNAVKGSVAYAGAGEPTKVTGNSSSSSGGSSSGGGLVSVATNPQTTSDASAVLGIGEDGIGNNELGESQDTTLFVEGSVFVKLCRNGRMKRRLIRVTPDHRRLLWSPPNSNGEDNNKQPPSSLPLEELVDITVGCLYTTAKKFDLTDEMEARCVSLQFSSRRLDLFAADLSNSIFTRWIGFFHQKVAQQQQQRQHRLRLQQQQMSQQKRLFLLHQSRATREEAAAKKLEIWRDEVLPFWDTHWTCEAVPVAVPARPSPLAVFVSFAASTTSALVRLPRSMILKHLNRSHRLGLLQKSPSSRCFRRDTVSLHRLRKGVQAGGTLALNLGRATTRQIRKLASLPAALGGCTGSLSVCSRETDSAPESLGSARYDTCLMGRRCRRRMSTGGGPGTGGGGGPSALAQQTRMVGTTVAAEANAYIHLSHLGTTWVGRYSLDRGRRLDTATHPAFVRLWLGGLPGELRGKLWLIALGNEQNICVPLLEALMQLGRLQGGPPGGLSTSAATSINGGSPVVATTPSLLMGQSDEGFQISCTAAAAEAAAAADNSSSTAATGAIDMPSSCISSSFCPHHVCLNPILDALRRMPIRGIPYLMGRKVAEGPLLLTTSLDELREEGAFDSGAPDLGGPEMGTSVEDMCAEHFAPVPALAGAAKRAAAGGPPPQVAPACRVSDNFVPSPKPRKQQQHQQQHPAEEAKPSGSASPHPQGAHDPLPVGEQQQQQQGRHQPESTSSGGGSSQQKKAAKVDTELPAAKPPLTPNAALNVGASAGPPSADSSPFARAFRKMNSGAANMTKPDAVGKGGAPPPQGPPPEGPSPTAAGAGGTCSQGAGPLLGRAAEAWEKGEMTIGEGARVLLEAYVLYRYVNFNCTVCACSPGTYMFGFSSCFCVCVSAIYVCIACLVSIFCRYMP